MVGESVTGIRLALLLLDPRGFKNRGGLSLTAAKWGKNGHLGVQRKHLVADEHLSAIDRHHHLVEMKGYRRVIVFELGFEPVHGAGEGDLQREAVRARLFFQVGIQTDGERVGLGVHIFILALLSNSFRILHFAGFGNMP